MNIWNEKFKEPDVEFPEKVVLDIIAPFEDVVENLASLKVVRLESVSRMTSHLTQEFQFKLILVSNALNGYSFEIFKFGYGVTLYPVEVIFEDDIGAELGIAEDSYDDRCLEFKDQVDYTKAVKAALTSNKFKETVGGLMKIARAKLTKNTAPKS